MMLKDIKVFMCLLERPVEEEERISKCISLKSCQGKNVNSKMEHSKPGSKAQRPVIGCSSMSFFIKYLNVPSEFIN